MTTLNLFLRTNRAGVDRALYRCRAIGVGTNALRDAAAYLLHAGLAQAADTLRIHRGRIFHRALSVGTAAGVAA